MKNVYRTACKIPPEKNISITCDGDTLAEDVTVKDLDLDEGDVLDVQID
jgi:Ubiquitin-2 like Rad60 SUMO-like